MGSETMNDKDLLKEIKEEHEQRKEMLRSGKPVTFHMHYMDIDLLIEQAERVEELETEVARLKELLTENGYRQLENQYNGLLVKYGNVLRQNKRYREALRWYSENSPHEGIGDEALGD